MIRFEGKPFFWKSAFRRGLTYVQDLYVDGSLINVRQAFNKFGLSIMEYNSIITALPRDWRKPRPMEPSFYQEIMHKKSISPTVYRMLTSNTQLLELKKAKWERDLNRCFSMPEYVAHFRRIYVTTNVPKIRSFQYRTEQ